MKIEERYQKPIEEFVRRALERYRDEIESIILFGSVARGEGKEESDVDILVIGDVSLEELVDISFPILLEYGELISAKDMKKERLEYLAKEGYSFVRNVIREGVVLYERMGEAFGESRREAKLGESFVRKSLAKAQTKREKADYDIYYEPSEEEAESIVEDAEKFLERIKVTIREIAK